MIDQQFSPPPERQPIFRPSSGAEADATTKWLDERADVTEPGTGYSVQLTGILQPQGKTPGAK